MHNLLIYFFVNKYLKLYIFFQYFHFHNYDIMLSFLPQHSFSFPLAKVLFHSRLGNIEGNFPLKITPRFHQDRSLPFVQREKREEKGKKREVNERMNDRKDLLFFYYSFIIFYD